MNKVAVSSECALKECTACPTRAGDCVYLWRASLLPWGGQGDPTGGPEMNELISMIVYGSTPLTPTTTVMLVLLLMTLRIVRALQREPVRSRRAPGTRRRPHGV